MKKTKRIVVMIMIVLLMNVMSLSEVYAGSEAGKTETTAIELKVNKSKKCKFWGNTSSSVYYVIAVPEQGKLSISVSAEKLGTSARILLMKSDVDNWKQTKTIKYNKTKKLASGTMNSEYILPQGIYKIQITPGKMLKTDKKFTISTKFTPSNFFDVEPNNMPENAQSVTLGKTYSLYMTTGTLIEDADLMDCVSVDLKDATTMKVAVKSKVNLDGIKLLIQQKDNSGYNTIQTFELSDKELVEKVKLSKGTYYFKLWSSDVSGAKQIPYTIKLSK